MLKGEVYSHFENLLLKSEKQVGAPTNIQRLFSNLSIMNAFSANAHKKNTFQ